ncbi:hypothetical protein F5141DRAFT_1065732 [Pisolithus sp. B1]|nr:hypothetical protein F5141DRAFT_1065732 [Pisolithus sp. B1]
MPWQIHFYKPVVQDILKCVKQFSHCNAASVNAFLLCPHFTTKVVEYVEEAISERLSCGLSVSNGWWPHYMNDIGKLNHCKVNSGITKDLPGDCGVFLRDGMDENLKVILNEVVSSQGRVSFRIGTYMPVCLEILGLMKKCNTSTTHVEKTRSLQVKWATLGRSSQLGTLLEESGGPGTLSRTVQFLAEGGRFADEGQTGEAAWLFKGQSVYSAHWLESRKFAPILFVKLKEAYLTAVPTSHDNPHESIWCMFSADLTCTCGPVAQMDSALHIGHSSALTGLDGSDAKDNEDQLNLKSTSYEWNTILEANKLKQAKKDVPPELCEYESEIKMLVKKYGAHPVSSPLFSTADCYATVLMEELCLIAELDTYLPDHLCRIRSMNSFHDMFSQAMQSGQSDILYKLWDNTEEIFGLPKANFTPSFS